MKKKILVVLCGLLLCGCQRERIKIKTVVNEKEEMVVEIVEVEHLDFQDDETLQLIIREANKITNVIDIELLHNRLIELINSEIDKDKSLEEQEDQIGIWVKSGLKEWKKEVIDQVLLTHSIEINEDDLFYVIKRISTSDAYKVMFAYEMIYLRKYND